MIKPSVERFGEGVRNLFKENRMVVFLCGPSLALANDSAGAALRKRIKETLEQEGFEVVLGEDDGLEDVRLTETGGYAHENELEFISRECGLLCWLLIVSGHSVNWACLFIGFQRIPIACVISSCSRMPNTKGLDRISTRGPLLRPTILVALFSWISQMQIFRLYSND